MYDVIIIGAGPAGLTAGIYCGRAKLKTKIIDKAQAGGQLNLTDEIENFPGVYKTTPKNLINTMLSQVKELKEVEVYEFSEIVRVKHQDKEIHVTVRSLSSDKQEEFKSKALIVASGANPKKLGIKGEQEFIGKGVSYCAVCDGPFFKDKEIALIGGGNTAIEEAIYLTKFVKKVYVIHRRDQLRATGILRERVKNNSKIELVLDSTAEEIIGDKRIEKIRTKNVKTNEIKDINCSGVFIFVGYVPNTVFINNLFDLNEEKYIITDNKMMTNKQGIFACGDCRQRPFKQVITACGEGAVAAYAAEQYLSQL